MLLEIEGHTPNFRVLAVTVHGEISTMQTHHRIRIVDNGVHRIALPVVVL